jgi:hypothetical protein
MAGTHPAGTSIVSTLPLHGASIVISGSPFAHAPTLELPPTPLDELELVADEPVPLDELVTLELVPEDVLDAFEVACVLLVPLPVFPPGSSPPAPDDVAVGFFELDPHPTAITSVPQKSDRSETMRPPMKKCRIKGIDQKETERRTA